MFMELGDQQEWLDSSWGWGYCREGALQCQWVRAWPALRWWGWWPGVLWEVRLADEVTMNKLEMAPKKEQRPWVLAPGGQQGSTPLGLPRLDSAEGSPSQPFTAPHFWVHSGALRAARSSDVGVGGRERGAGLGCFSELTRVCY